MRKQKAHNQLGLLFSSRSAGLNGTPVLVTATGAPGVPAAISTGLGSSSPCSPLPLCSECLLWPWAGAAVADLQPGHLYLWRPRARRAEDAVCPWAAWGVHSLRPWVFEAGTRHWVPQPWLTQRAEPTDTLWDACLGWPLPLVQPGSTAWSQAVLGATLTIPGSIKLGKKGGHVSDEDE